MTAPATVNDPSQAFNKTYAAIQSGGVQVKQVPVFDDNTGAESMQTVLVDSKGNQLPADQVVQTGTGQYQILIGSAGGTIHATVTADPKTGTVAPVTDYSDQIGYTGGSPGSFLAATTNAVNQMVAGIPGATLIPGVAPVVAGLNAVNSLASGKINTGTILNGLTAATGLGNTLGLDPSTIANLNTAKTVASGVNAAQKGNALGVINAGLNLTGTTIPSDVTTAMNALSAANALSKSNIPGLLSASANLLTGSTDVPGTSSSNTQTSSNTSTPSGVGTLVSAPVVGKIVDYDIGGINNPFTTNEQQSITMKAKGGSIGLPSLLRGR